MKSKIYFAAIGMMCLLLVSCASTGMLSSDGRQEDNSTPLIISFYEGPLNHLSSVRSGTCPMYPSCSQYSKACFRKHGFLMGWFMTCDRLMRCGRDETHISPNIKVGGGLFTYDPLENNDFWRSADE